MASEYFSMALGQSLFLKKAFPSSFSFKAIASLYLSFMCLYIYYNPISQYIEMQCQIKSKYRGIWQQSTIDLDSQNMALVFIRDGKSKQLSFNSINRCQTIINVEKEQQLMIVFCERQYEIKGENKRLKQVVEVYKLWKFFQDYKQVPQQKMQKPKVINYQDRTAAIINKQRQIKNAEEKEKQLAAVKVGEKRRSDDEVVEYEDYYKQGDWKRDREEGGLLFINQDKKSLQPKIIKFVISKFISTGSFMGISFPVFAMKPQSILQTYCRCLSLAPRLLTNQKNPIERMKAFNAVLLTLSLRFIDIDKSFNPTLGQTFQTSIQGCTMSAQQISHHPPISAFLLIGEDFELYGCLQVQASMGFNTARGRFYGDIVVQYEDGGKLVGRLPCGMLSGYLFGRYVFYPDGANYAFDPLNQLLCSYRVTNQDIMEGYIGRPNHRTWLQFCLLMNSKQQDKDGRQRKYESFQHIGEEHCEKIYTKIRVNWTKSIHYDGQLYLDYEEEGSRPPKLSKKVPSLLLASDSRFRKDIILRNQQKMEESQQEKERLEQQERRLRKLRENYANSQK